MSSIINANMECLLEIIDTCYNNPEKSSTTKVTKQLASVYSLFTHCPVDATKIDLITIEVKTV